MKTILNTLAALGVVAAISAPALAGTDAKSFFSEQDKAHFATDAKSFFDTQDRVRYATDARSLFDGLTRDGR